MEEVEDYVKVAIRIRPSRTAPDDSAGIQLINPNAPVLFISDRQQSYAFDNVFSKDVSQEQVFERMVKPLIRQALLGYNCTVFAYGQTGTGKTYTIGSDPNTYNDAGFILRTLSEVFDNQEQCEEVDISISFFEIYNEKVFDLLGNNKAALLMKGFKIEGLTQKKVRNGCEAYNLLKMGSKSRHVGETKQNRSSSRSHAIFTIYCNVKHGNSQTMAKLNLVDLAGSESVRKTGNEGSQFQEGVSINKGLFYIGRVINALSTNSSHVPHRQSVVTSVLRDSLNRTNYITLVACISPDFEDLQETVQTLEFAQGAKKLKIKPEINNIIQQYQKDNPGLFERSITGSAAKIRATPLKRLHLAEIGNNCSTVKRQKLVESEKLMPVLVNNTFNQTPSSPPLLSMSVKCSTPNKMLSMLPPLTPIVQKLTTTFQNCMLENLNESSLTPTQNMLECNWHKFSSEVRHTVRTELLFLIQKNPDHSMLNNTNATSFGGRSGAIAKKLIFNKEPACLEQAEPEFKVPAPVRPRAKKQKDGPSTSSSTPRRSTRRSAAANLPVERRRSARLSMKATQEPPQPTPRQNVQRLKAPIPAPRKNVKKAKNVVEDPMVNHSKYILDILNTGSQKDLQKLPSVGPKTATQIYYYRQINGQFNSISDLGKMESWRGSGYQRFLKANSLKTEED